MAETQLYIKRERDPRIDIAKGILIILVVLGHCVQVSYTGSNAFYTNWLFKLIYSFHMPAFMLISGWLFYGSRHKKYADIVTSKLKQIGVPFLAFCGVCYLIKISGDILFRETPSIWSIIWNFKTYVFSSHAMWFLLSVLINSLIVGLIPPRSNYDVRLWIIALCALFIPQNVYLYAECVYMFPYFVGGYFLNMNRQYILAGLKNTHLLFVLIVSCVGLILFNYKTYIYTSGISLWIDQPMPQLLINIHRFILGLTMSVLYFHFVSKIPTSFFSMKWVKRISGYGKTSLAIYGFQNIIVFIFISRIFTYFNYNGVGRLPLVVVVMLFVLLLCHWCIAICNKSKVLNLLFCGTRHRSIKNE